MARQARTLEDRIPETAIDTKAELGMPRRARVPQRQLRTNSTGSQREDRWHPAGDDHRSLVTEFMAPPASRVALATFPSIHFEMAGGLSLHIKQATMNGVANEVIDLPKTTLWH